MDEQQKSGEVMVLNLTEEQLAEYEQYAKDDGVATDAERMPILKINYVPMVYTPEDAMEVQRQFELKKGIEPTGKLPTNYKDTGNYTIPLGAYVVGQRKDKEERVIDQGEEVKSMVIFKIRNQYNYYDQKETKNNCHSIVHEDFKKVVGNNYGYECGANCPYRAKERTPHCQATKIVFVTAITVSGKAVDAVMYIKGANFMPFLEYTKAAVMAEINGVQRKAPVFSFITNLLPPKAEVNGAVTYYIAQYERGKPFSPEIIKGFHQKALDVENVITQMNSKLAERSEAITENNAKSAIPVADAEVPDLTPPGQSATTRPAAAAQKVVSPVVVDAQQVVIEEEKFNPESIFRK